MKKSVLILLLAAIVAGGAFAQAKDKKMALTIDIAPIFKALALGDINGDDKGDGGFGVGAALEWGFKNNYSVGVQTIIGTNDLFTDITVTALGRLWPLGQLTKVFVGAEIGVAMVMPEVGDTDISLLARLRSGWRENLGSFTIEPSIGYTIRKGVKGSPVQVEANSGQSWYAPAGWDIGLAIGFAL